MTNDSHKWNVLVLAPSSPLELWNPSDKSQIFRGMREEKTHTTNWTADITMKQSRLLVGEVKSFSSLSFLKIFFVKASLWSTVINNKVIFFVFFSHRGSTFTENIRIYSPLHNFYISVTSLAFLSHTYSIFGERCHFLDVMSKKKLLYSLIPHQPFEEKKH